MTIIEYERNGISVIEKHMSYSECEQTYGTSCVPTLNRKFTEDALRATDGNCSHWAIYANDGITVVVEC